MSAVKWLLLPHFVALAAFSGAFAVMAATGTNRTDPDFWLGLTGFVTGLAALVASFAAVLLVTIARRRRAEWPWLLVHLVMAALVSATASSWLGAHIA